MKSDSPLLEAFHVHLRRGGLSNSAADHYVGAIRRGLRSGDLLSALREATSPSGAKLARAGLLRWARWRKDTDLEARIPGVPYLRERPRKLRCTGLIRTQLYMASRKLLPEKIQPVVALALSAPERIGDFLDLTPAQFGATDRIPVEDREKLLRQDGWKHVRDLLGPTPEAAYAVYRRGLRRLCKHLGTPPLSPEDLRALALYERGKASAQQEATR